MITLGKKGDLSAIRQAASYIRDKATVTKLFSTIAPRYKDRPGGYTRIIKLGIRPGDAAPLSVIEFVEEEIQKKAPKKKVKKQAPVTVAEEVSPVVAAESPVEQTLVESNETAEVAVQETEK